MSPPRLNWREDGDGGGAALVLIHGLGMDLSVWDDLVPLLPSGLKVLRFDLRGHGGSDCPPGDYAMGALIRDAERLLDARGLHGAVVLGLGEGGLVAAGLAVKRLDQVRALVLSNTAAKIGTAEGWRAEAALVRAGGMAALAGARLRQWFGPRGLGGEAARRAGAMLLRQPAEGHAGCCAAIAGADLLAPLSGLRLPALAIAATEDGRIPPDLVRETAGLIPGADLALIRGAGHLACLERPGDHARALAGFLARIGQVRAEA